MVTKVSVTPEMFGLPSHPLKDVVGGKSEVNAEVFREMLKDPSFTRTKMKTKNLRPDSNPSMLLLSSLSLV
jgi:anthranilate phosphoribosyltransferase